MPKAQHCKLNLKTLKCTLIGYIPNQKAYYLVHCPTRWIIESQNMVFDEGNTCYKHIHIHGNVDKSTSENKGDIKHGKRKILRKNIPIHNSKLANNQRPAPTPRITQMPLVQVEPHQSTRPQCLPVYNNDDHYGIMSYAHKPRDSCKQPPPIIKDNVPKLTDIEDNNDKDNTSNAHESAYTAKIIPLGNSCTFKSAMASPNMAKWLAACRKELHSFKAIDVCEEVECPHNHKVIRSK